MRIRTSFLFVVVGSFGFALIRSPHWRAIGPFYPVASESTRLVFPPLSFFFFPSRKVHVPGAEVEEMLPAAQLLSRRAAAAGDYIRAKSVFLQGVKEAQVVAETLKRQIHSAIPPSQVWVTRCRPRSFLLLVARASPAPPIRRPTARQYNE